MYIDVDYTVESPLTITVPVAQSGDRFCIDLSTVDDLLAEGTEQFELFFENLPSDSATVGDPATLCVNIGDDDGMSSNIKLDAYSVDESAGTVTPIVRVL